MNYPDSIFIVLRPDDDVYGVFRSEQAAIETANHARNRGDVTVILRSLLEEPHDPGTISEHEYSYLDRRDNP